MTAKIWVIVAGNGWYDGRTETPRWAYASPEAAQAMMAKLALIEKAFPEPRDVFSVSVPWDVMKQRLAAYRDLLGPRVEGLDGGEDWELAEVDVLG